MVDIVNIFAPKFPESVPVGTLITWYAIKGDIVKKDQVLAEVETDKVVLEVVAPNDGIIHGLKKEVNDEVCSQEAIATFVAF